LSPERGERRPQGRVDRAAEHDAHAVAPLRGQGIGQRPEQKNPGRAGNDRLAGQLP
jgi:hypothetical protein